jgi:aminomethyltransferase
MTTVLSLKRTPLFDQHLTLGAKMVPFAGWEMPVSYPAGIIAEHTAVRNAVGLFDIGHMGLIKVEGENALALLQKAATNDASKLAVDQVQYSVLCNERGGTIDDILVYRLPMSYLIVANASNMDKVLAWLSEQAKSFKNVSVSAYDNYCMLSIQGPQAVGLATKILNAPLAELQHNHTLWWRDIIVSRTGYTGEDGVELIVHKAEAAGIWEKLIAQKAQPCGLGARDTLRLEAGLPLYGHEYNEETNPLEAGYAWAVKFDKGNFVGREALLKEKETGLKKKLVGLALEGRIIPREGCQIVDGRALNVGVVTSGTFSPTLKKPIALAYLESPATEVCVEIRGNLVPAKIVAKNFIKR